jgi:hypothetical protein
MTYLERVGKETRGRVRVGEQQHNDKKEMDDKKEEEKEMEEERE